MGKQRWMSQVIVEAKKSETLDLLPFTRLARQTAADKPTRPLLMKGVSA